MLGLLGLFGALFAGFMADGVMSVGSKSESDDTAEDGSFSEASPAAGDEAEGTVDLLDIATSAAPLEADDPSGFDVTDTPPTEAEPGPENLTLTGGDGDDILTGNAGADTISGGDGVDLLGGRDGDDLIDGGAGDDYIDGGSGADTLLGGDDDDFVQGNDGNDLLDGGNGNDSLAGHMHNDNMTGDIGDDSILGGDDDDTLSGGEGDDWLAGGYGNDELHGDAGQDTLDGNAGNDTIWGFDANNPTNSQDADFLNGGTGEDTLMIGAGDYAHGGEGADQFTIGDWIGDGGFAHITDYNPDEDDIVVMYDSIAHPDPFIELVTQEGSGDATLLLDGIPLALIADGAGLSVEALTLMPSNLF
ncbi:calcium-binding protein [Pseudorhodobacter sp.]|uniref:calcium-binding protein n=1 Tax=Pseudorhodobacter sp. TaxID=1934400 RepID=UPI0039E3C38C